jgi:hypothetical protein
VHRLLAGLGFGLVVTAAAACDTASTSGASRYCDVVKQVQASVDPLADQSIYADPARLKDALVARVKTYTDLAGRAPDEIRPDANLVRDGVIKVNNALAAAGYQSVAANSDPTVQAVLADPALQAAQSRLASYDTEHCSS